MFLINDLVLLCTVHCVPVAFLCSSVTGQHNIDVYECPVHE